MISAQDLEITDLFEDDDVAPQNGDGVVENTSNDKDDDTTNTSKGAVAKRIVRNPQPKLNPQRLCGDRGIVLLPKIFSKVKLKGKGHEKEDLDIVMKTLEHWSHRLFPKFTFDDVLERIEKLGTKKAVQNCVNRIRLDMPVLSEDYVNDKDDNIVDSEDENVPPVSDEQLHATIFGTTSTTQENHNAVATSSLAVPQVAKVLTADQLARIEQNRLLALEKRAARLRKAAQSSATLTEETPMSAVNITNMSNSGNTSSMLSQTVQTLSAETVCEKIRSTDETCNSSPEVASASLSEKMGNMMECDNSQMKGYNEEFSTNTNHTVIQIGTPVKPMPEICLPTASSGGLNLPNDRPGLTENNVSNQMEESEPMEVDGAIGFSDTF